MNRDEWYKNRDIGLLIWLAVIICVAGLFLFRHLLIMAGVTFYQVLTLSAYLLGFILLILGMNNFINDSHQHGLILLLTGLAFLFCPYLYLKIHGDHNNLGNASADNPANSLLYVKPGTPYKVPHNRKIYYNPQTSRQ